MRFYGLFQHDPPTHMWVLFKKKKKQQQQHNGKSVTRMLINKGVSDLLPVPGLWLDPFSRNTTVAKALL